MAQTWDSGMRPNIRIVVLKMLKRGVTDFRTIPHLLAVFMSMLRNTRELRRWRRDGGRTLALALIEHMGDIIAAEPMSRRARNQHPDARIGWIVRKPYRDVVENYSSIDKIITVECMTEWLMLWGARTTDQVWDMHISGRPCLKCGIAFHKPGKPGKITYSTYYNHGNLLAVNCLSADQPVINDAPQIIPDAAAVRAVDDLALPPRIIVIHCKSNEASRDWVVDKWRALVQWITHQTEYIVCEIGSQPQVVKSADPAMRSLCGTLSIMQTAEVIRRAALFVGIDSGPAHLAHAVGTPGVILLGRYATFETYNPYSAGYADGTLADLLRGDGVAANIEVEAVIAAASRRLGFPGPGLPPHGQTGQAVIVAPK